MSAQGIVVPLVRIVAETQPLVRVTHHPPIGTSGFGPPRAAKYMFDTKNYFDPTTDSLPLVLIIETQAAMDKIEAIAAVPGVEALF